MAQKDLTGLYGYDLVQALSDENGMITENVMFELLMGYSIGREPKDKSSILITIRPGRVGNNQLGIDP